MSKPRSVIAIVDHDESVCRALGRLVGSLGVQADTFTSGQEFVEMLDGVRWVRVDCVVLDMQMPGMTGLEVQERLARSGHLLPVIFITTHDEVGMRERTLTASTVAF